MMKSNYRQINTFGNSTNCNNFEPDISVNNPLTYCLNDVIDIPFSHGSNSYIYGQSNKSCQQFMADYCANKFDEYCVYASKNTNSIFPNNLSGQPGGRSTLNAGEILIYNTAAKKYLKEMNGNCYLQTEPFDPVVSNSPFISSWVSEDNSCRPVYTIKDTTNIDNDVVMNLLLEKPYIGLDILLSIYDTMKKEGRLSLLNSTKLGKFYSVLEDSVKRQ